MGQVVPLHPELLVVVLLVLRLGLPEHKNALAEQALLNLFVQVEWAGMAAQKHFKFHKEAMVPECH